MNRLIAAALVTSAGLFAASVYAQTTSAGSNAAPGLTAAPQANAAQAGAAVYRQKCAFCHDKGQTGTLMLGKRLGEAQSLIAQRTDLTGDYVEFVVRNGLLSMPAITRVEVTDAELAHLKTYLGKGR